MGPEVEKRNITWKTKKYNILYPGLGVGIKIFLEKITKIEYFGSWSLNNIIWKPNKKDTFLGPGDGIGIFIGKLKKKYIWGPGVWIGVLL